MKNWKSPTGKTIRRTAVREIGVSRHHWDPIKGPSETSRTSQLSGFEGFEWSPQLGSNYADTSFFQSRDVSVYTSSNIYAIEIYIYICIIYVQKYIYMYILMKRV